MFPLKFYLLNVPSNMHSLRLIGLNFKCMQADSAVLMWRAEDNVVYRLNVKHGTESKGLYYHLSP